MSKQEQILEVAIKRLAHFGVGKTTLTEIADDLDMTKQALVYYYPDKQSLVTAVLKKIATEYMLAMDKILAGKFTMNQVFEKMVDARLDLFTKYQMLLVQMEMDGINKMGEMDTAIHELKFNEEQAMAKRLKQAIDAGECKKADALHTVRVVLDTIASFARNLHSCKGVPEAKDHKELAIKQKEVIRLFMTGIEA